MNSHARDMNTNIKKMIAAILLSAVVGWVAMVAAWAIYVFLIPHGPNPAPEVGLYGAFLIFGIMFTYAYIAAYFFVVLPGYFLLRSRLRSKPRWQGMLAGALLFLLGGLVLNFLFSAGFNLAEFPLDTALSVCAGVAVFSVLHRV